MLVRVTDYSLIESDNHAELVEAVCAALNDGWVPAGGVCVWFEPGCTETNLGGAIVHYAQALVKYAAAG
jgi:hypothetical protein